MSDDVPWATISQMWLRRIDARIKAFHPDEIAVAALTDLLERGLVVKYGRGRSHGITLTEKGRKVVAEMKAAEHPLTRESDKRKATLRALALECARFRTYGKGRAEFAAYIEARHGSEIGVIELNCVIDSLVAEGLVTGPDEHQEFNAAPYEPEGGMKVTVFVGSDAYEGRVIFVHTPRKIAVEYGSVTAGTGVRGGKLETATGSRTVFLKNTKSGEWREKGSRRGQGRSLGLGYHDGHMDPSF